MILLYAPFADRPRIRASRPPERKAVSWPASTGGSYPNDELRLKTPTGERPSPSGFTAFADAHRASLWPGPIPLRPTTTGIFSPQPSVGGKLNRAHTPTSSQTPVRL
jgi:hypothetical protein